MTQDSVGKTVGENLHKIRVSAGESQSEAAQRMSQYGLDWKRDHVASLETGRRATVTVDELLILSRAYGMALSYWFEGDGDVGLTATVIMSRREISDALDGKAGGLKRAKPREIDFANVVDYEADQRVADRLSVDREEVTRIAHGLWGHTLTDERNRRLADAPDRDPKTMRTLRSGMTKRLMREIAQSLESQS